ncbi:hypothetical protein BV22DRAFT_660007 [Leucogyrophana mollusca]|uniref:Uncharacterized protein n=1 Tax=Leucogyrophana mollusca TaxID=85980 RepID=A0ACB8BAZ4_9AGAM|nr:hypothetical protein BV22DRAFT_660007 [Leucogyrophana mollusca]
MLPRNVAIQWLTQLIFALSYAASARALCDSNDSGQCSSSTDPIVIALAVTVCLVLAIALVRVTVVTVRIMRTDYRESVQDGLKDLETGKGSPQVVPETSRPQSLFISTFSTDTDQRSGAEHTDEHIEVEERTPISPVITEDPFSDPQSFSGSDDTSIQSFPMAAVTARSSNPNLSDSHSPRETASPPHSPSTLRSQPPTPSSSPRRSSSRSSSHLTLSAPPSTSSFAPCTPPPPFSSRPPTIASSTTSLPPPMYSRRLPSPPLPIVPQRHSFGDATGHRGPSDQPSA